MSETPSSDSLETLQALVGRVSDGGSREALHVFKKEGSESISSKELGMAATSQARRLLQDGLEKDQTVILIGPAGPPWLVAALAVLRTGAVVVPLDAQLSDEALAHCLSHAEPDYVLAGEEERKRLDELDTEEEINLRVWNLEDFLYETAEDKDPDSRFPESNPDDRAFMLYTSGTTGRPKGVPLTHNQILHQIWTVKKTKLITSRDAVLLPLPFHHVYPLVIGLVAPLTLHIPIILPHALTGKEIRRALREGEVTACIGVPRFYEALMSGVQDQINSRGWPAKAWFALGLKVSGWLHPLLGRRAGHVIFRPLHRKVGPRLRVLASGGAALDDKLAGQLIGLGWEVAIGYGLTETAPLLTLNLPGAYRSGSVGRPAPDTELKIDPDALEKQGEPETEKKDSPVILAPNHASYLDAPALAAALPYSRLQQFFWAGWRGVMFGNPFMRRVSALAQVLPVDPRRSAASSLALGAEALRRNHALVWFPEGRRSPSGKLQVLRPGLGLLATYTGTPVVPVWISGSQNALPVGRRLPRPGRIEVRFGSVLHPPDSEDKEGNLEELSKAFTDQLTEALKDLESGDSQDSDNPE